MSWLVYLLDLELLFPFCHIAACAGFGVFHLRRSSSICHLDVGHDGCEVCGVLVGGVAVLWCSTRSCRVWRAKWCWYKSRRYYELCEKVMQAVVIRQSMFVHVKARHMDGITSLQVVAAAASIDYLAQTLAGLLPFAGRQ